MRTGTFVVASLLLGFAVVPAPAQPAPVDPSEQRLEGVVYLVRHAEKVDPYPDDPSDPPLTDTGRARAADLARTLVDAGVTRILSTDYRRTRETAAPLAKALGLEIERYDPSALEDLARRLAEAGERVLVVGHSNTTPRLAELLGGEPGPPIDEPTEYDRLYVLTLRPGAEATTVRLRFGDR
jgi:broad specificity phosphatase PhoE